MIEELLKERHRFLIVKMPRLLTSAELAFYRENGFFRSTEKLFSEARFSELKKLSETMYDHSAPPEMPAHVYNIVKEFPDLIGFIITKDILDLVEGIIGPDIGLHASTAFVKRANSQCHLKWHTDFYQIEEYDEIAKIDMTALVIAMTSTDVANGCVKYLPGSHKYKKRRKYKPPTTETEEYQTMKRHSNHGLDDAEVDFSNGVVHLEIPEGYFSFHDIHVVHASDLNTTAEDRILLNFTFFNTNVSHLTSQAVNVLQRDSKRKIHLRGKDSFNTCYFSLLPK